LLNGVTQYFVCYYFVQLQSITVVNVRRNEIDVEDLKNVYYSIAVARYTKHLGFTSVQN